MAAIRFVHMVSKDKDKYTQKTQIVFFSMPDENWPSEVEKGYHIKVKHWPGKFYSETQEGIVVQTAVVEEGSDQYEMMDSMKIYLCSFFTNSFTNSYLKEDNVKILEYGKEDNGEVQWIKHGSKAFMLV